MALVSTMCRDNVMRGCGRFFNVASSGASRDVLMVSWYVPQCLVHRGMSEVDAIPATLVKFVPAKE